jgi:hypothetical protein
MNFPSFLKEEEDETEDEKGDEEKDERGEEEEEEEEEGFFAAETVSAALSRAWYALLRSFSVGSETLLIPTGEGSEEEEEEEEEEGREMSGLTLWLSGLSSLILNAELEEVGGGRGADDKGRGRGGKEADSTVSTGVSSIVTEGTYNPAKSVLRLLIRLFTALTTSSSISSLFSPSVVEV